jgi:2-methylisocitrate lyase-like PEP mutase family enzyme
VQTLERAGAAVVMIEDAIGPASHFQGRGAPLATQDEMVQRVRAAVDARKDPDLVILVRSDAAAKGRPAQAVLDVAVACADAGADAFFFSGFSLAEQTKARDAVKRPLMIGGGPTMTPAQWQAAGVSMAFYHVENVALGAIHIALKELKATGKYETAAKMQLSSDMNARLVNSEAHTARARKYKVMPQNAS